MPSKSKFSMDDSIQLVALWYELKDIHNVRWRYSKDKGIEKFSRKLPSRRVFKCVIDRFKSTVIMIIVLVTLWPPSMMLRSGEP